MVTVKWGRQESETIKHERERGHHWQRIEW
jgi:hypothetical protein